MEINQPFLLDSSDYVASITGTANQVLANGTTGTPQTGTVTLTLPQSIATTSTPTFAALNLLAAKPTTGALGGLSFGPAAGPIDTSIYRESAGNLAIKGLTGQLNTFSVGGVYASGTGIRDGITIGHGANNTNPGFVKWFSGGSLTAQMDAVSGGLNMSTGSFGIGVTPSFRLHVYNSANVDVETRIEATGAGATARLTLKSLTTRDGEISWNDGSEAGRINYSHVTDTFRIFAATNLTNPVLTIRGILNAAGPFEIGPVSVDNAIAATVVNANATVQTFLMRKALGTLGSGAAVVTNGTELGAFVYQGYEGANYRTGSSIVGLVDGATISSTSMPGRLELRTTPSGSVTEVTRLTIFSTGVIRHQYDASNYMETTISSTGSATLNLVGTTPKFTFSDPVIISNLTAGRVPYITTSGEITDDADMTFATDTLTVTKIIGSTSIKVGTAGGYISSDGSTGATGTFTTADLKTVTVKDGIITSIV